MSPWVWMAVTCLLLGISGGVRFWREWTFSALAEESAACPFALSDLPRELGTWQAKDNAEIQLDPEVARFAGASDHIMRDYHDQKTGELASVMALYGLGTMVYLHSPEVCYPAAGYQLFMGPVDRTIEVPGLSGPLRYRWAVYRKQVGGLSRYEEVYHAFLHHGDWVTDASDRWKTFRHYPGLFKIQVARIVSALPEDSQGPCLSLLGEMARQIQDRLATARGEGR